ncbi:MAG: 50S ribosomal protein L5 [Candidatus Aenigmatarchaeota archaeon]
MKRIRIEKVVLNIGCGGDPNKIERATKLLEYLTGRKVFITKSKRRSTFGIARGKPVGVMVTLRKGEAFNFLKNALKAVDNKLNKSQFNDGNFSFGIKEYINIPNIKYRHDIGMLGLDVCVSLERPGFRVERRKIERRKIERRHRISKEETINWVKNEFGVEVV